jgi:anthranilate synthase component 2
MRLLVLDNYDSFTYNLVHLLEKCGDFPIDVVKNDRLDINDVIRYDKILLSPGPGLPSEAGVMPELLKKYAPAKSILGICLGLQAIGENFGCRLSNLNKVYHGLALPVTQLGNDPLFRNCPQTFNVGRYHSWVIAAEALAPELTVTAVDGSGFIMAAKHNRYDVRGVQFHPESILSDYGETIIRNWLYSESK